MFKKSIAFVSTAITSMFVTAHAAVPAGVDTAITGAQTDVETVGGYIIGALAGLIAVFWIIKMVRRA